ncbi:arginine kinase Oct f 2 isoform X3, partial [Biomphalaria glabrata]
MDPCAEVERLYRKLIGATESHSLLKKHLTNNIYTRLKCLKTKFNGTLADCIRS